MLRIALKVKQDALEDVLDRLLPLLPAGVHQAQDEPGVVEVATYGVPGHIPSPDVLEACAGDALLGRADVQEVPYDWRERRRLFGRGYDIGGRIYLRSPFDPPAPEGKLDIVVDRQDGTFGTGAHPTTRSSLELMLRLEPRGPFADLGCGTGTLAIAAAKLGFEPVLAVDYSEQSVDATRANAELNGVAIDVVLADLLSEAPPIAPTVAANIPPIVHRRIAEHHAAGIDRMVLSGVVSDDAQVLLDLYLTAGLQATTWVDDGEGWATVLLERNPVDKESEPGDTADGEPPPEPANG